MITDYRELIAEALVRATKEIAGIEIAAPRVDDPPRPDMGDLACAVALQVAKRTDGNPRQLAERYVTWFEGNPLDGVVRWTIAGPGFLNAHLDRGALALRLGSATEADEARQAEKVLIEHTSINPNKAAHIGHLRNSCMGDTLARIYRALGHPVEVHNYIDDTGVQVADVVIGFLDLRGLTVEQVRGLPEPFDYLCWDLYTEVSERMASDEGLQTRRREVLLALEDGLEPVASMGAVIAERIVERHLLTMARMGIHYDLLVKEGDILTLDLWSEAFERLKTSDSVRRLDSGKYADCWVMHLSAVEGFEALEEADKVLVRSNGVATYVAKDIAYHFWKYGILERDFGYEQVPIADATAPGPVWRTVAHGGSVAPFGHADRAITVIDVRQSYLQAIVAQAFQLIGEEEAGRRLTHFAYEMVALSPATAIALGIPIDAESEDRQFVEMSGRRGFGVKADDLLNELQARATREVAGRNPELPADAHAEIGRQIAVGAARYFLLRFNRNTVIVFDLDDALNFEGETGPYIQYAAVRAAHIFDRLETQLGQPIVPEVEALLAGRGSTLMATTPATLDERLRTDGGGLWQLLLALGRYDEVVEQAARTLEVSLLAKYTFGLAQHFNRFYHGYPILQAEDPADRDLRILVAYLFQRRLRTLLGLLGIPLPDRM